MTIRVLVADDERLVRSGLRMILEAEADIEVVADAADGAAAIEAAAANRPDVVLMDIRMPLVDGLEATRRILAGPPPRARVVILTTFDLDEYVYTALRNGASAFLLKDAPEERLLSAIRVVAAGGSLFDPAATRRLIERFTRTSSNVELAGRVRELTARELDVLRLVAAGRSNAEIAAELVVSDHTIKTHVAHILGKLELRDRVQVVVFAYEAGVVRVGTASAAPVSVGSGGHR